MFLNIITVAICLAIVLVFRQFDNNNKSLEKVKKFTDKVRDDFDSYFVSQSQQIKNAGVELDVKQSQAVAAVKRLEQNIELFEKKSQEVEERLTFIDQIEKKVSAYDTLLKELMEMTDKVEENLQRVSVHSKFLQKTEATIEEQQKKLSSIEKHIPELLSQFSSDNKKQLDQVSQEYYGYVQEKFGELTQLSEAAVDKNQELLAEIEQVFQQSLNSAVEKANNLEDQVFQNLKEQTAAREEQFENELQQNTLEIESNCKNQLYQITSNLDQEMSQTKSCVNYWM